MKKKSFYLLAVLLSLVIFQLPAQAEDKYLIANVGSDWWGEAVIWSPAGLPQNGDSVYITPNPFASIFYYDIAPGTLLETLSIDSALPESGPFPNLIQGMDMFATPRDGGSISANNEFIGITDFGMYGQSNGDNSVTNTLTLGVNPLSHGIYDIIDGSVSASYEIIGQFGIGEFNQRGGTNTVTNDLLLGSELGSSGTYTISGGTLNVGGNIVGGTDLNPETYFYSSELHIDGGTVTAGGGLVSIGGLILGFDASGNGNYTLTQGNQLETMGEAIGGYGTGTFTQTGGLNTVNDGFIVGHMAGSSGTYELIGGELSASGEFIGFRGGTGSFSQTGGTNNTGYLALGEEENSSGNYSLNGNSTLTVNNEVIGKQGSAAFTQGGGTHNVSVLTVADFEGSVGTFDLNNGSLTAASEYIGYQGSGTFSQSGGTNSVPGTLTIAEYMVSSGTYNLSGGTLTAGNIVNNDTFNYSGGELHANLENNGTATLSGGGTRTVDGDVINNGTIKVTDTTAVFTGTFTNNGEYISDPSDNYFGDLVVGDTGYFVGGAGDTFLISGDLTISSTQDTLWDTASAYLGFTGTGTHTLDIIGSTIIGGGAGGNPLFETIELLGGGTLIFLGGGSDIYIDNLVLSSGSSLDLGGSTLYYNTYTPNGGSVSGGQVVPAAVPEPGSLLLLGSGLVGMFGLKRSFNK